MDNLCNFSTSHYIQTLKNYQKTHNFCFFNNSADHDVILRHDIDFSLEDALRIAKIEYDLGIKSGALGGKLTGAGGGGHLLFYCEPSKQKNLIEKMQSHGLKHVQTKFYESGCKVLDLYDFTNSLSCFDPALPPNPTPIHPRVPNGSTSL